ncbi:MAG: tRNA 4-thiouridine(8) synthase ThiI [candidate division WOR-3 bacterium]
MPKAVCMFSGGLDSILACRLILEQKVDVIALHFLNPFHPFPKSSARYPVRKAAEQLGIPLKIIPLREEYIQMVKKPKYGYGAGMNPCVDCRIFTLKLAKRFMEQVGADFVFSGEVLGQRPLSQHLQAMKLIEKISGLEGRLLRPLSARLLEPTLPETEGVIDREKLLFLQGRSRKPQIALAEKYGIRDYPNPAGGCLLTDKTFSQRLKEAFGHNEETVRYIKILRIGRHFRLPSGKKAVVGRNERENRALYNLATKDDTILEPVDVAGPLVLVIKSDAIDDIETAARLCARYSDGKHLGQVQIRCDDRTFNVAPLEEEKIRKIRID